MGIVLAGGGATTTTTPEKVVTFYTQASYGGTFKKFKRGAYDRPGPSVMMLWDYRLRSIKIPPGCKVTLYPSARFQGTPKVFTSDTPDIGGDYRDNTCSFTVETT